MPLAWAGAPPPSSQKGILDTNLTKSIWRHFCTWWTGSKERAMTFRQTSTPAAQAGLSAGLGAWQPCMETIWEELTAADGAAVPEEMQAQMNELMQAQLRQAMKGCTNPREKVPEQHSERAIVRIVG